MEKNEQNKETTIRKRILERRNAIFFDKEELVALQDLQKDPSQTVDKSDQQSFQTIASSASQKIKDKAQVSGNSQKKLPTKENLQR